jgi:TolA-binding protein
VSRGHTNAVGERIQIPNIPEGARTPLVKGLVDVIEWLVQKVQQQEEQIAQLQDEIAVLKGEKKRPRFKPRRLFIIT